MKKNVGGQDRTVRIALGLLSVVMMMVILFFAETFGGPIQVTLVATGLLLLSFVLLGTAGAEKCLINQALGRNTYDNHAGEERP
ncbi:YgaP-like transmembrane domain [Halorubrum vacuolatum]|uniref:Inner membrane protein YgaP-like transmembrane domain-containing protein n=1 Tax=Halorubrum vacuolatum TaxID=63740 RepID=A0A238WCG6_HALVU|nr:YgaP-like transmembrane domain [Halorubrum vacuolatum]SNR44061.1 Protein of unknown function [Halorubrum vacuolatum]